MNIVKNMETYKLVFGKHHFVWKGFKHKLGIKLNLKKFSFMGQKVYRCKGVCGGTSAGPWEWKGQGQAELRRQGREKLKRNVKGAGSACRFREHLNSNEVEKIYERK